MIIDIKEWMTSSFRAYQYRPLFIYGINSKLIVKGFEISLQRLWKPHGSFNGDYILNFCICTYSEYHHLGDSVTDLSWRGWTFARHLWLHLPSIADVNILGWERLWPKDEHQKACYLSTKLRNFRFEAEALIPEPQLLSALKNFQASCIRIHRTASVSE